MPASIKLRRFAHGLPGRNLKLYATERLEPFVYRCSKLLGRHDVFVKSCVQDGASFLFHGVAVLGGPHAQPPLQLFIQIANSETGHNETSKYQLRVSIA